MSKGSPRPTLEEVQAQFSEWEREKEIETAQYKEWLIPLLHQNRFEGEFAEEAADEIITHFKYLKGGYNPFFGAAHNFGPIRDRHVKELDRLRDLALDLAKLINRSIDGSLGIQGDIDKALEDHGMSRTDLMRFLLSVLMRVLQRSIEVATQSGHSENHHAPSN